MDEKVIALPPPYSVILTKAMRRIAEGKHSDAEWMINNFYHRQKRTREEYIDLLRQTLAHDAFNEADDKSRQQLMRILFHLDRKHNHPANPLVVMIRRVGGQGSAYRYRILNREGDSAR